MLRMLILHFLIINLFYTFVVTQAENNSIKGTNCSEQREGECLKIKECKDICRCSRLYYYNETTKSCELNIQYLRQGLKEKYSTEELNDLNIEGELARKLRLEADRIFSGIIVSVIIFITCASICALAACTYCCRVNYTDRKLRKDVQALAKKLARDGKLKKPKKEPCHPKAESCNIIVEDAGVFVV